NANHCFFVRCNFGLKIPLCYVLCDIGGKFFTKGGFIGGIYVVRQLPPASPESSSAHIEAARWMIAPVSGAVYPDLSHFTIEERLASI
ncbi:MAG: hypothetical protein AAF636_20080, partial [Pseudomonadota bacterium]